MNIAKYYKYDIIILNMKSTYPSFSLRQFGFAYEDLPAFHAAYFMLTLIFAGIFNLGFFAALIVLHIALDFIKYKIYLKYTFARSLHLVIRESLVDVALFFLAVAATVYLHPTLPYIAAFTGGAETRMTIIRGLLVLLPKLTILHHTLRIIFRLPEYLKTPTLRTKRRWTTAERIFLIVLLIALAALALAPETLHATVTELQTMIQSQLVPWNI